MSKRTPRRTDPSADRKAASTGDETVDFPAVDGDDEAAADTMTLEQLSDRSGVSTRTIRYYQAERLLQKPERDKADGRVARYHAAHLERLRLIGELRDRGLKLPAIRDLLAEGHTSSRVSDWLGLDDSLRGTWAQGDPKVLTSEELNERLAATPPGTRSQLEDADLLSRQGSAWLVVNPALFDLTLNLLLAGVPGEVVLRAGMILRRHLGVAAHQLVDLFVDLLSSDYANDVEPSTLIEAFRPTAGDAARLIFESELNTQVDSLLNDTRRLAKARPNPNAR